MPQRRSQRSRGSRRSTSKRPPLARAVLLLAVLGLGVAFAVILGRQFAGYFGGHQPTKQVAVATSPTPQPSALPSASPVVSPPPSGATTQPKIAIIIDDCGYNLPRDLRFLNLPVPVTLSILPMTPHGKEVAAAAESAGKSVMLHIPMEPESAAAHPGPGEITTEMTDDQVMVQLNADIASLPPLPGANNHMGSKASSDPRVMRDVLAVLKRNKMFFIDSMTSQTSVGAQTARDAGVPTAARDVFLDNKATVPYVEGQIKELEAVARRNGTAIAIGHPNPETAEALEKMIPELRDAGFTFVSAESLVK